ncbi:MAG: YHS domain-containing (seleno)protein [Pseudomonadota bacterium]
MIRLIAAIMVVLLAASPAAAKELRDPEIFADVSGHAIKGYDPVSYFTQPRPSKGNPAYSVEWKGAKWLFATPANRDRFAANPEKYAPQYGGYCAWAIAQGDGRPVAINPEIYKVVDNKLYLNLNMNVHEQWLAKQALFITKGNENWPDALILSN